jgi:hypothetical protein
VQLCFVLMPFGTKPAPDGKTTNFDKVYEQLIKPAIASGDLEPLRADHEEARGIIQKPAFGALLLCPVRRRWYPAHSPVSETALRSRRTRHAAHRCRCAQKVGQIDELLQISMSAAAKSDVQHFGPFAQQAGAAA